jgi:hypothetical protein
MCRRVSACRIGIDQSEGTIMTRTSIARTCTALAIAVVIAGCGQVAPAAPAASPAASTNAGPSAASPAPGSNATACQDLTAFKTSVDELRALDLASLDNQAVVAAVADVESAATSLEASAKAEAAPEVEALGQAILGLKLSIVNLTSEETPSQKTAEVRMAVEGVDQATTALTSALAACQ